VRQREIGGVKESLSYEVDCERNPEMRRGKPHEIAEKRYARKTVRSSTRAGVGG